MIYAILAIIIIIPQIVNAACTWDGLTGTVASPYGVLDVDACVTDAAGKTGNITIAIPTATVTWSTPVTIDMSSGWANVTDLIVTGNGIANTIITDATTTSAGNAPFWITGNDGLPFEITAFRFEGTSDPDGVIKISGDCKNWRIHNNYFYNIDGAPINIGDRVSETWGVIDNNIFYQHIDGGSKLYINGTGETSWTAAQSLGTASAIYVEDNIFDFSEWGDGAMDAYNGARFVFRHNSVINTNIEFHGADSGGLRSAMQFEIYSNTFANSGTAIRGFHARGGSGVIYDNTYTGSYSDLSLASYRSCASYAPWGQCETDNPYDGDGTNGYACLDQVGRTTNQGLYPVFEWGNTEDAVNFDLSVVVTCAEVNDHIQENRDFYNDTEPSEQGYSYTPYTYPHPLRGRKWSAGSAIHTSGSGIWSN